MSKKAIGDGPEVMKRDVGSVHVSSAWIGTRMPKRDGTCSLLGQQAMQSEKEMRAA